MSNDRLSRFCFAGDRLAGGQRPPRLILPLVILAVAAFALGNTVAAQQPDAVQPKDQQPAASRESWFDPPWRHPPTLGGKLLWTDEFFLHEWRIQRNARSGQFRLLDGDNRQYAVGGYVECRAKLEEIRREKELPPMRGKVVIALHGLGDSRTSMSKLCRCLREKGGFTVLNMSYASTQEDVAAHARALDKIVSQLGEVEEVHFVGHSLGNIVVRKYLHDRAEREDSLPDEPKIGRFVMLAPPNHGSVLAETFSENVLYSTFTGETGQQLGRRWQELEATLGTPPCEFGIVAGGWGNGHGLNPLIPGDDDGTVAVASTRLAGAADFIRVPALHTVIMNNSNVIQYTLRFLQEGCFVAPDKRQPIVEDKRQRRDEG